MAERKGLFGRLGEWYQKQRVQYNLQKAFAERDAAAGTYITYQDGEYQKINQQMDNPYGL